MKHIRNLWNLLKQEISLWKYEKQELVKGICYIVMIAWLFFDRIAFAILLIPYLFVFMKQQRIHKVHREKEKLRKEFREMMISIGNSLSAGYSIENALKTAKNVTKQFGFIHAINKGSNVWNDVSVTNSTFYEFYISPGVFGAPTANVPIAVGNKVVISNCTFYNWGSNKDGKNTYRAVGNFSKLTAPLNLSVNNCVFGSSESKVLDAGGINLDSKGNYCTSDFEKMSDAGLTLISLDTDDASLFRNIEENDFTVIDAESVIYKSEYGDPRWITVLD